MTHKMKIISGGQTGVDRAALDAAIACHIPYGGLIPKGRLAEDGMISKNYSDLTEAQSADYKYRTEKNVIDSDATLIIGYLTMTGKMTGGTHLTNVFCHQHDKTHIFVNLENAEADNVKRISEWMFDMKPNILNIAGPRESKHPGIYEKTRKLLEKVFKKLSSPLRGSS